MFLVLSVVASATDYDRMHDQTNAPNFKSKLFNGTINVPSAFMKERIKKNEINCSIKRLVQGVRVHLHG